MALMDDGNNGNNMVMPVSPMGNNGGGFGCNGDFGGWLILFLLFGMFNGGWGNGWNNGGTGGNIGGTLYPWMNQSNQINDGFRDQMIHDNVSGIRDSVVSGFGDTALGIAGINQNICQTGNAITGAINSGFAGTTAAVTGAQNAITQQMYANQIADLERSFAAQTANTQGMTALQSQLASCCCDNRLATEGLKATVLQENCADRYEAANNTRDIIDAQTRNTQAILDKLCQIELDGVKGQLAQAQRENTGLQNQLNMATMAASQAAQTATFQQGLNNEVDALYNRLKNCPVGTVPVFGNQPIFTCPTSINGGNGCGCGNNY